MIELIIASEVRFFREGLALRLAREQNVGAVHGVASCAELLTLLPRSESTVVLVDMAMPDSMRVLREVHAADEEVRVLALALPDTAPAVLECAEAGIAGYVSREGSLDDLVTAVHCAARGEAILRPEIANSLLRRLSALAKERSAGHQTEVLTAREREIASLVDDGMSNKAIAARLCIEVATVKNHVHNILAKLQVRRRAEIPRRLTLAPSAAPRNWDLRQRS